MMSVLFYCSVINIENINMIVQMNKQGVMTLTAENAEENHKLFEIANESNFKAKAHYTKPTNVEKKPTTYKKRAMYTKSCPVEGCDHKAKSMKLHLRNAHGIHPDGTVHGFWTYNGASRSGAGQPERRPVAMPVQQKPDGSYKVKESDEGLLGHPESKRSRILG